jgi:hypothetical protein
MSSRSCPDWPALMELAPDLQFKHYTVSEAHLPSDALAGLSEVRLDDLEICCDLEHNVVNADHTDPAVVEALRGTHWFDLREWSTTGPGAAFRA